MADADKVAMLVMELRRTNQDGSPVYPKGKGMLHYIGPDGEKWCCMGVASHVAAMHGLDVTREMVPAGDGTREVFGDSGDEVLCPEVADWYGFVNRNPSLRTEDWFWFSAGAWNDTGTGNGPEDDFEEIADAFSRTYLEGRQW